MSIEPNAVGLDQRGRSMLVFGVAVLLTLIALIGLVPAWSMPALPFVLASSELSPLVAGLALVWLAVTRRLLHSQPAWRRVAMALLIVAALVALRPIAEAVLVVRRADASLRAVGAPSLRFRDALRPLPPAPAVRRRVVHYAAADGAPLAMELFDLPNAAARPRPIVVVLYGGAWRGGETDQGERTSAALARRGYLVAAIDYRHAPRYRFPAELDDVRRSIALVLDSATNWHADPARLALLGRSAGGHLAELSAFAPGGSRVRAVVAIYAPWNLADGYRDPPSPDPVGVRTVIGNFVGGTPSERPQTYREASPASYVHPGLPPVLLIYGARDHLVKPDFNREAARALHEAAVPVVAVELPWSEHGFDLVPAGLGERIAWGVMERFLSATLGK